MEEDGAQMNLSLSVGVSFSRVKWSVVTTGLH